MSGKAGEDRFEVRLGRIRSPDGARKLQGVLKRLRHSARRGKSRRYSGGRSQRAAARTFARRVIVKVSIVRMNGKGAGAQRMHLNYIGRDSAAREDEPGKLYDRFENDVDAKAFEERGKDDRHQFRVIVSPEDGHELKDLKPFVRDIMAQMEHDLGTRIDWVAANHYDTDNPHSHIVIGGRRDDGKDLVVPREYVSRGLRERAQERVTLELGPVSEREARLKIAREVQRERLTQIDRGLLRQVRDGSLDLSEPPRKGQAWRRPLEISRLRVLQRMGLASSQGKGRWTLSDTMEPTLKRMGARVDIIKTMHRVMAKNKAMAHVSADSIYDPWDANPKTVTGRVMASGISDDVNDRAYVVIDGLDGKAVYIDMGASETITALKAGTIVKVVPPDVKPKPSDITIDKIAAQNGGRYSPAVHLEKAPKERPEFVQAHVRRLEALRRAGHVTRHKDGSWTIPKNYLDRATNFERERAVARPVTISPVSTLSLRAMQSAIGATWLDEGLRDELDNPGALGFGGDVEKARAIRRQFLFKQGILKRLDEGVAQTHLAKLEQKDLDKAGVQLTKRLGKAYLVSGERIAGTYKELVDRPSGKYAIIECSKDFTLVPWRDVLERNQGKAVSGIMRGGKISWTLTKGRGIT